MAKNLREAKTRYCPELAGVGQSDRAKKKQQQQQKTPLSTGLVYTN